MTRNGTKEKSSSRKQLLKTSIHQSLIESEYLPCGSPTQMAGTAPCRLLSAMPEAREKEDVEVVLCLENGSFLEFGNFLLEQVRDPVLGEVHLAGVDAEGLSYF